MPGAQAKPGEVVELDGLPHAGEVIAGKYQVEKVIGAGGMGVVVIARHLLLNQPVAVKFLHPQAAVRSDPVQRFLREARAAAALRSEHVARVIDVATLPSGDPYMVMEYLDGSPLSRVIRTRAPLPVEEAVDYMLQACDAIGEAHGLGIVHRDLKPGNMFIVKRPNGTPLLKVLDFGIAKAIGDGAVEEQTLTATNMIMGSPQYASPEQLRSSKNVDTRTDIWALGVILYYMLSGRRPFEADSMAALCMDIAMKDPPSLTALRPNVPAALEGVILRCLKKDREQRMPDIATLAAALKPFAPASVPASQQALAPQALAPGAPLRLEAGAGGVPLLGTGDMPSQPSSLLSNATTEPHAATLMTRSAWTAPPTPRRRPPIVAIQAVAVAVAAAIAVAAIYYGKSKTRSDGQQVESVTSLQSASATAKPAEPAPADSGAIIIDHDFVTPQPAPRETSTPTAEQGPEPAPEPSRTKLVRGSRVIAKVPILLRDKSGAVVGNVPKGSELSVVRESDGMTLVVYSGSQSLAMGWAPTITLGPAP